MLPTSETDSTEGSRRGVGHPFVVVAVAALVAGTIGAALADGLRGDIDLSGIGWLIGAAGFGSFAAFLFFFDAMMVRRRGGLAFPTADAALGAMVKVAVVAAVATVFFVPMTLTLLMGLGTSHSPLAGPLCIVAAGGVFVAAVVGVVASVRARLALR